MTRRRRHLSRTTIAFLIAITFWLLILAWGVRQLNHPSIRARIAREVEGRASAALGQEVRIADVQLGVFPPRLVIKSIAAGPVDEPFLRIAGAEVMLGRFILEGREVIIDHLRVSGLRLAGKIPESKAKESENGKSWFRFAVRQLELVDLQLEGVELPGKIVLSAKDIEVRWNGSRRTPIAAATLRVGSFDLQVPSLNPISGKVEAWGRGTPDGWQVQMLRGIGRGWSVAGKGEKVQKVVKATAEVKIELEALDQVVAAGAGMKGSVDLTCQASYSEKSGLQSDAHLTSPRVEVSGFIVEDLEGEMHVSAEGLDASLLDGRFAGGKVEGSYRLERFAQPWRHHAAVRGSGVSLAGFLAQIGGGDSGMVGRCDASGDVTWDGLGIKQGNGTAVANIQPALGEIPVSGRVVVTLPHDGALHFQAKNVFLAGAGVRWEGTLALGSWLPNWNIRGEGVQVATIGRMLRGWVGTDVLPEQLQGTAVLDLTLRGPFDDLTVAGDVAVAPISYGTIDADGLEASLRVGQGRVTVDKSTIVVGQGRVTGVGELRYGEGGKLAVKLEGKGVPLVRVGAWGGVHGPFGGTVGATGTLFGTLEKPEVDASLVFSKVSVAGVPFGDGEGQVRVARGIVRLENVQVGAFQAATIIDVAKREVVVDASLRGFGLEGISPPLARLAGGALDCSVHGEFPFDAPAGKLEITSVRGARGVVELDDQGIRLDIARPQAWALSGQLHRAKKEFLGKLNLNVESWRMVTADLFGSDVGIDGAMHAEAEVKITPPNPALLVGTISKLEVEVEGERAKLRETAPFRIEGSAISFPGVTLVGPRSSLSCAVSRSADGVLDGQFEGEVPGALLGLFWRESRPSGRANVAVRLSGSDDRPRFEGSLQIRDALLHVPDLPAPVTKINGNIELTPEGLVLEQVAFSFLGGQGVASGRILLEPRLEFDLVLRPDGIRWPLIPGLAPSLTGELRLVGNLDNLSLSGRTVLQHTAYRREINLQKLVVENILAPDRARVSESSPMTLNLAVAAPASLEINTPLARLTMQGDVRIVGTTNRWGVLGRLEALPGGELELTGVRYELERGVVTFTNAERFEPVLDILARTFIQEFEITVGLTGTLDRLTPVFSSNPPLPEMDIISLISVGRRAEEAGGSQAGAVASSFISDQFTSTVTRRARTLLDLDQLRVDPFAATQNGSPTARMTVVKQISRDWTVTLSTNLNSNREEIITSRWRLGSGLFVEAIRDTDGAYALELKWQRRY